MALHLVRSWLYCYFHNTLYTSITTIFPTISVGGTDFNASVVTSLLITPANTIYTVPVIIIEDGEDENEDQMFSLTLATDDEGVSIIPDTTIVTITDTSGWNHF